MDEIHKLQSLIADHDVTIKMNTIGCSWLRTLSFEDENMVHHFVSKDLKNLFNGMIEEIENKYKE